MDNGNAKLAEADMTGIDAEVVGSIDDFLHLLAEYRWIYDFKLTKIFLDDICNNVPTEWLEVFQSFTETELNEIPFGHVKDAWPKSLKDFIERSITYSMNRDQVTRKSPRTSSASCSRKIEENSTATLTKSNENTNHCQAQSENSDAQRIDAKAQKHTPKTSSRSKSLLGSAIQTGMSDKKQHEVVYMASYIHQVMALSDSAVIVDVGSGLGYLGQELHDNYGHRVLGLESKSCHTSGAEARTAKIDSCPYIQNITCEISKDRDSQQELCTLINAWTASFPPGRPACCHGRRVAGSQEDACSRRGLLNSNTNTTISTEYQKSERNVDCDMAERLEQSNADAISIAFTETHTNSAGEPGGGSAQSHNIEKTNAFHVKLQTSDSDCVQLQTTQCGNITGRKDHNKFKDSSDACFSNTGQASALHSRLNTPTTAADNSPGVCCYGDITSGMSKCYVDLLQVSEKQEMECNKSRNSTIRPDDSSPGVCDDLKPATSKHYVDLPQSTEIFNKSGNSMTMSNDSSQGIFGDLTPAMSKCYVDIPQITEKQEMNYNNSENSVVKPNASSPGVCLVGLHCCGDLTPAMLQCYVDVPQITALCCVSCCYHRMSFNEEAGTHTNFPLSEGLRKAAAMVTIQYPNFSFTTFSLRLAAQETRARWRHQSSKEHDFHSRNVAYRATLEICLNTGNFSLKKTSRKLAHKSDFTSFSKYVDAIYKHVTVNGRSAPESDVKQLFKKEMHDLYGLYQQYFYLIEPITALQYLLQPVLETLIHRDRQLWLKEHGFHSNIVPIFDEYISPRNLALVAMKRT